MVQESVAKLVSMAGGVGFVHRKNERKSSESCHRSTVQTHSQVRRSAAPRCTSSFDHQMV